MVAIRNLQFYLSSFLLSIQLFHQLEHRHLPEDHITVWSYVVPQLVFGHFIKNIDEVDLQNHLKEVENENRPESKQFMNDLITVFRYYKKVIKHKRKHTLTVDDFKKGISDWMIIINFMVASANYCYFYHYGFNVSSLAKLRSENEQVFKLMMSSEDYSYSLSKIRPTFYQFIQLFVAYLKFFPTHENSKKYTDCYFDQLLGFRIINDTFFNFDFEKDYEMQKLLESQMKNFVSCMFLQPEIKESVEKNVILKRGFENITKTPFEELHKKHELFKNHLELAIGYFKKAVKLEDCRQFPMYQNSKNDEFNFQKIVNLLTQTAMKNYVIHKIYYPEFSNFTKTKSEEMQKLMPTQCVPGLNENKEIFKSLYQYIDFLNLFSTEKDYEEKQYLNNILELLSINEKIEEFVSNKNNASREALIISIKKGIRNLSGCLEPKEI